MTNLTTLSTFPLVSGSDPVAEEDVEAAFGPEQLHLPGQDDVARVLGDAHHAVLVEDDLLGPAAVEVEAATHRHDEVDRGPRPAQEIHVLVARVGQDEPREPDMDPDAPGVRHPRLTEVDLHLLARRQVRNSLVIPGIRLLRDAVVPSELRDVPPHGPLRGRDLMLAEALEQPVVYLGRGHVGVFAQPAQYDAVIALQLAPLANHAGVQVILLLGHVPVLADGPPAASQTISHLLLLEPKLLQSLYVHVHVEPLHLSHLSMTMPTWAASL